MGLCGKKKKSEAKVGVIENIEHKAHDHVAGWGRSLVVGKMQSTIAELVEEKRLVFIGSDTVEYTNRQRLKRAMPVKEMAAILAEASGLENLVHLGVSLEDISGFIAEAHTNQLLEEGKK